MGDPKLNALCILVLTINYVATQN